MGNINNIINNFFGLINREVLDFAEYLKLKHNSKPGRVKKKWADVRGRGRSTGETAGETVVRMRGE